jgi:hypothetical protein
MAGPSAVDQQGLFLSDLRLLVKEDDLLVGIDGIKSNLYPDLNGVPTAFTALLGMRPFLREERAGPELRVGVHYMTGDMGGMHAYRQERHPYDTLISAGSGMVYFVDSVRSEWFMATHTRERFGADLSLVFRSGGRSRWTVHGGLGLGFGLSVNNSTRVYRGTDVFTTYPGGGGRAFESASRDDLVRNANGYWLAAMLPVGVSFRLSRHGHLLRHIELMLEGRPQLLATFGEDLGDRTYFGGQWLFGLRYQLRGMVR